MPPVREPSFGRYELLGRLAQGGGGSVFVARSGAELVALKTLRRDRADDEELISMFLDEARLTVRFDHPSCIRGYGYGQRCGVYYLALEYVHGVTLFELVRLARRDLRLLPALPIVGAVAAAAEALDHAHSLSDSAGRPFHLVHRDVSPSNVMVALDGSCRLVDFGVARAETGRPATRLGVVKGKYAYMSPEHIRGKVVDRRSDLFSLGVVLYEALAARALFHAGTPEETFARIHARPLPSLLGVVEGADHDLDDILARALELEPDDRFQTGAEMAAALRGWCVGRGLAEPRSALAALVAERVPELAASAVAVAAARQEGADPAPLVAALRLVSPDPEELPLGGGPDPRDFHVDAGLAHPSLGAPVAALTSARDAAVASSPSVRVSALPRPEDGPGGDDPTIPPDRELRPPIAARPDLPISDDAAPTVPPHAPLFVPPRPPTVLASGIGDAGPTLRPDDGPASTPAGAVRRGYPWRVGWAAVAAGFGLGSAAGAGLVAALLRALAA
jgi:hypothetical protein